MNFIILGGFMILFAFLFLFLFGASTVVFTKKKFGEVLPFSLLLVPFILFLSGIFFHTFKVAYILFSLYIMSGVLRFLFIKEKKDLFPSIFSVGFFSFLLIFLVFSFIDFHRDFTMWDEFSHWGMMVKEMLRLDQFYTTISSNLAVHKDYPPFVSLFEMIFCKIAGYSEMNVSLALHLFLFSLIMAPFMEKEDNEKFLTKIIRISLILFLSIFTILAFDSYHICFTIYIDVFITVLFYYGVVLIYEKNVFKSLFHFILLLLILSALILSKQIGIFFSFLLILYYLICNFVHQNKKERKILNWVFLFVVPVVFYILWKHYVSLYQVKSQFVISNMIHNLLQGNFPKEVLSSYLQAIIHEELLKYPFVLTYCTSLILFYICFLLLYQKGKLKKKDFIILTIFYTISFLGYMFLMLFLYLFAFDIVESSVLASYTRYMSTVVIWGSLVILYLFFDNYWTISKKDLLLALFSLIIFTGSSNIGYILPSFQKGPYYGYKEYADFILEKTMENSSVLLLTEDKMTAYYFVQYYANDRKIYIDSVSHYHEDELIKKEFIDYDYIYFLDNASEISFQDISFEDNAIYKIIPNRWEFIKQ